MTACMDLEGIRLSEISQRDRQILYDFSNMWNLKENKINEQTKLKQIHRYRQNKLMVTRWERGLGGTGEKEEGIKKYQLPVIKIITGNDVQCRKYSH